MNSIIFWQANVESHTAYAIMNFHFRFVIIMSGSTHRMVIEKTKRRHSSIVILYSTSECLLYTNI
jgi:hypothetical protein